MFLSIEEIVKATGGKILNVSDAVTIKKIDTDSRIVTYYSLFVALKGENNDGHNFIFDVIKKGCKAVLVSEEMQIDGATVILVKDTKIALGDIARYYVNKLNLKKIAITGSVGKTTTKEMIASVCEKIDKTGKTQGNFNNDIGVPLTAFSLNDEKIAIFEMGMNHFGEIEYLSQIVNPEIAVITNIGYSHIENLGSREGILKAKLEILKGMDENSYLILNGDDPYLYSVKNNIEANIIYFGIENKECDIVAKDIKEENETTIFKIDDEEYKINVLGVHNVYNALSAISVGRLLSADNSRIKEGLLSFKPDGIRQNIVKKDGYTFVIDCYNAAPDSMIASLNVLSKLSGKRKIAVFGSVAELGDIRDELLYEVGKKASECDLYELITLSSDALSINKGAKDNGFLREKNFSTNSEILEYLKSIIKKDDVVLIKGSRKYKMEEISEGLVNMKW